jgi:hypothetical protein
MPKNRGAHILLVKSNLRLRAIGGFFRMRVLFLLKHAKRQPRRSSSGHSSIRILDKAAWGGKRRTRHEL